MKFSIITVGCKTNKADSTLLSEYLMSKGAELTIDLQEADVVFVNSCTVTAKADRDVRKAVYRAKRFNPNCKVVIVGCLPTAYPNLDVTTFGAQGAVAGLDFEKIAKFITTPPLGGPVKPFELVKKTGHSRAVVKIQEGCDRNCSYCIVPAARGKPRSVPIQQVLERIQQAVEAGFREIVLSGTHLDLYQVCSDGKRLELSHLMAHIQATYYNSGVRFRLSSLEPGTWVTEIASMLHPPVWCRHLHISLQHSETRILERMGRHYTFDQVRKQILEVQHRVEGTCIGLDIITGFPGESEKDFDEQLKKLQDLPFAYLHAFPFSSRPTTPAASYSNQVEEEKKKERTARLRSLSEKKRKEFVRRNLGKRVNVLPLGLSGDARMDTVHRALTDNYLPCVISHYAPVDNSLLWARIVSAQDSTAIVEVEEN